MRNKIMPAGLTAALMAGSAAYAQAPAAGSTGGGLVNPNQPSPQSATGIGSPGASSDGTVARNNAGTSVIGKTSTPDTAVAGSTGGKDSGVHK